MNAVAARWKQEEVRLWAGSALAALLVHFAIAALLFLRIQWQPRPSPQAGSPVAVNVELASLPSLAAPAASSSLGSALPTRQAQTPSKSPSLAAASQLQPLAEVQPISQEVEPTPSNAAQSTGAVATAPTPELFPLTAPDLTAPSQPNGQLHVPQSPEQQWLARVKDQLQRHKQYPRSAVKELQQDTVTLKFSVNGTGQVTYVRIDSAHHYRSLEREVRRMLQLAGSLPTPSAQMPVDKIVWSVPVDFYLTPAKSSPTRCSARGDPGPAPIGATATVQQMGAYRARLSQYLAASGKELDCLAKAPDATAQASRNTLTRQVHSMVDNFNAQARLFEAKAQAETLQAELAHQRQLRTNAAQVYANCPPPVTPPAPTSLNANTAQSYRRNLLDYQSAVRAYVACIREARSAATAPERGLASDQRAQIDQTAMQLGDAAILPFNQLAAGFNGQVPRLRQQALAAQEQNLAELDVRATAIFPNSTWSVPAPLPTDECFSITQSGQAYQAKICQSSYVTPLNVSTQMARTMGFSGGLLAAIGLNGGITLPGDAGLEKATQQEQIAAIHGVAGDPRGGKPVLGIAAAPNSQAGQQTGTRLQTTVYAVSELQVAGRHISLTIGRRSLGVTPIDDSSALHFDLVLSADGQSLHGYCWTDQRRWQCTLPRHLIASGPGNSRH